MSERPPFVDLALLGRAWRVAACQVSVALAAVLIIVGAVVFAVDVRLQDQQVASQLQSIVATVDDVTDPPPGTIVGMRPLEGGVEASARPDVVVGLLEGPIGPSRIEIDGECYSTLVAETARGRVVALISMYPYQVGRVRLLWSLAVAAGAGLLVSLVAVAVLARRLIRPLSQALDVQRRFVADASHELRAPLTVLHTRAQLLARRAAVDGEDDLAVQAAGLVDDARALSDVIDDLLEWAATAAPAVQGDPVDLAEVVAEAASTMGGVASSMDVTLGVDRAEPSAGFTVRGTSSALRRALVALIDNALAHEHTGGTVLLRLSRTSRHVVVAVIDDGAGVDPAALASMFTRFTRGQDQPDDARRRGHGIGLVLVREIARAHGGDVRYTETPGGGATFTLRLPAAD